MITCSEFLTLIRNALSNEEAWCKNFTAMDSNNNMVLPLDSKAVKWCLNGCRIKVWEPYIGIADAQVYMNSMVYLRKIAKNIYWVHNPEKSFKKIDLGITDFNDLYDHSTIMKMLDMTIEYARKQEE